MFSGQPERAFVSRETNKQNKVLVFCFQITIIVIEHGNSAVTISWQNRKER